VRAHPGREIPERESPGLISDVLAFGGQAAQMMSMGVMVMRSKVRCILRSVNTPAHRMDEFSHFSICILPRSSIRQCKIRQRTVDGNDDFHVFSCRCIHVLRSTYAYTGLFCFRRLRGVPFSRDPKLNLLRLLP
jgi:hypothetical protein